MNEDNLSKLFLWLGGFIIGWCCCLVWVGK